MQAFGPIGRAARSAEVALAQARYVYKALHETLHLAKRGWYFDKDLARAVIRSMRQLHLNTKRMTLFRGVGILILCSRDIAPIHLNKGFSNDYEKQT